MIKLEIRPRSRLDAQPGSVIFADDRSQGPSAYREDNWFSLMQPVGPQRKHEAPNRRRDVVKVETLLSNDGIFDHWGKTKGAWGHHGAVLDDGIRRFQKREKLKVDGLLNPGGPTIKRLQEKLGPLMQGFTPPTPDEVDAHQHDIHDRPGGTGSLTHVNRRPKLYPKPGLPQVAEPDRRANDLTLKTLLNYTVDGDQPRWLAGDIIERGLPGIAKVRAFVQDMDKADPGRGEGLLRGILDHLPETLHEPFLGGPAPKKVPLGVKLNEAVGWDASEIETRRVAGKPERTSTAAPPGTATSGAEARFDEAPAPKQDTAPPRRAGEEASAPLGKKTPTSPLGRAAQEMNDKKRQTRARERVEALGFEIIGDDHQAPLSDTQVTNAEYLQMLKEAENERQWGILEAGQYAAEKQMGTPPSERNLAQYKDNWVRDHATTIKVTARRHGIPPEVLAGIVHTETGGMPDSGDDVMNVLRSGTNKLPESVRSRMDKRVTGAPNKISAGDVSIQLRNVAKFEGIDPDSLDMATRAKLIDRLQNDKAYALDMAARYVKDTVNKAYPHHQGVDLDEKQVMVVGYGYNMGYPNSRIDPANPAPDGIDLGDTRSNYGPDLARKLKRMRELLK